MTKEILKNPGVNDLTENDFFDYLTHDKKSIWEVFAGQDNEPEIEERYLHGYEEAGVSESVVI